jgi:tetratricopeptide (TPR) repeat protein
MPNPEIALSRHSFFRTLFFVALAAASLVVVDTVLARTERNETSLAAARFSREGELLLQQHKYSDAADSFHSAIANARNNPDYPLALGQALLDAGQLDEANSTLTDLLQADSMAGAPNLAMARVFAKEGQFEQAAFYYHRAIYGQWKQDAAANQVKVRFELAGLLAGRNSKAELLAELLPLQEDASPDAATQARLARLFMTAGSPTRAAAIFRDLVHAAPQDAEAHQGLGDAEFALGDFAAAQTAFVAALHLAPNAPGASTARKALEITDQVLNLDPMRRGLAGPERYERSVHILQLVSDRVTLCMTPSHAESAKPLLDSANTALTRRVTPNAQPEAAEANLEVAGKLWQAAKPDCKPGPTAGDPLQLVLAKAAQ